MNKPLLDTFIDSHKARVESFFEEITSSLEAPRQLQEAMLYSLQAGGKRIRPMLLYAVLESYDRDKTAGDSTACALEMIHTYSLIHDDLPAMDNDDFRRGKPTNHKIFGEATAILAGDALLTHAFQLISRDDRLAPEKRLENVRLLSRAAGPDGMVGGQTADMLAEEKEVTVEEMESIHNRKTGDLLAVALQMGASIAGAGKKEQEALHRFGIHIGLAFQIKDDLLDVEGDEQLLGKPVGSDEGNHKKTYVSLLGLEKAKERLKFHTGAALSELEELSVPSHLLQELAVYIAERDQ